MKARIGDRWVWKNISHFIAEISTLSSDPICGYVIKQNIAKDGFSGLHNWNKPENAVNKNWKYLAGQEAE